MTLEKSMAEEQKSLTAKQVRAARALLAWSQQDLAKVAGVAPSTVADFERNQRTPVPNNADAIRKALEDAGISFPEGGAVSGPPIAGLGLRTAGGMPIPLITIGDLTRWASRRDSQAALPALIGRLARADAPISIHFPSDDAVVFPGWDGVTDSPFATDYVPAGKAGWEIGTQRDGIAGKATEDYDKRTADPGDIIPAQSTFIFVALRPWAEAAKWAREKRALGAWKDVRAYDGTDLVHWLESNPAVGQWLATYLDKRPPGTHQLEEVWEEWSHATERPLTTDLVLSDRDEDAKALLLWLRQEPEAIALQAATSDEVLAFAFAAISQLPENISDHYLSRCVVATTADAARALAESETPLIIMLSDPEAGLTQRLVQKGHHVLMAYDANPSDRGHLRELARPSRDGIEAALIEAGEEEEKAKRYAHECYRSLAALRRLMPAQVSRIPVWARTQPPKPLLMALLAGAWDENSKADQAILSRLANMAYDDLIAGITTYAGHLDSPLRKVGSTWKVASPRDAWLLLAKYLTAADIDRFEKAILDVLGATDPRFELDSEERWYASMRGIKPEYSAYLRRGLSEILIMLALFGNHAATVPHAHRRADQIVRKLLHDADAQRWWSLSHDFRLLAEAAPETFFDAVEHSLDQNDPPIKALFGMDETPMFGEQHLPDLLWALESLAWSPRYVARAATILARLDEMDDAENRGNRPGESLRNIFVLWHPQTFATLKERQRVLAMLRKHHEVAAWKLMLDILPKHHDTLTPAATTRWRDFSPETKEVATWEGVKALVDDLLTDVGLNAGKWVSLLEMLGSFPEGPRLISQLTQAVPRINDLGDRMMLWRALRRVLHHNREFADSDWAIPEANLKPLQKLYDDLTPTDPFLRYTWLFDSAAMLPDPAGDWDANAKKLEEIQNETAPILLADHGQDLIFAIADTVEHARYLGFALVRGGAPKQEINAIVERALKSNNPKHHSLADGLIRMRFYSGNQDKAYAEELFAKALAGNWGDEALQTILAVLPANAWTWGLAHAAGEKTEAEYWQRVEAFALNSEENDPAHAIERLIAAGRARHALRLAGHLVRSKELPSELLVRLLLAAVQQPFGKSGDRNEPTMFQYYVVEILSKLDQDPNVSRDTMLTLEWAYLPVLEYSKRPAKVIMEELARNPGLFVELICAIYKPAEGSDVPADTSDPARAEKMASQAYRLLRLWSVIPGTQADGSINAQELEDWVNQARKLGQERGRLNPVDNYIGEVLSGAPTGDDGIWPALPVRELIERGVRSTRLVSGFEIGRRNRRGITMRSPRDGGQQERELANWYRSMSEKMNVEWPRLAGILEDIAKSYDHDAGWHDDDAERLDW